MENWYINILAQRPIQILSNQGQILPQPKTYSCIVAEIGHSRYKRKKTLQERMERELARVGGRETYTLQHNPPSAPCDVGSHAVL